jgi:hypothetical protein
MSKKNVIFKLYGTTEILVNKEDHKLCSCFCEFQDDNYDKCKYFNRYLKLHKNGHSLIRTKKCLNKFKGVG